MPQTHQKGDKLRIQITGECGNHTAEVVDFDSRGHPILKILGDRSWDKLRFKNGDYIILHNQTEE